MLGYVYSKNGTVKKCVFWVKSKNARKAKTERVETKTTVRDKSADREGATETERRKNLQCEDRVQVQTDRV